MNLREIIGSQQTSKWFTFQDGFKLHLRYITKREMAEALKELSREGVFDQLEVDAAMCRQIVFGWKGLSLRSMMNFCVVSNLPTDVDMDAEIPFSQENLAALIDGAPRLAKFIVDTAVEPAHFRPDNLERQLKNSGSGPGLNSTHAKKKDAVRAGE